MDDLDKLGPLAALVGTWEGEGGLDVSFHHEDGEVGDTQYRERLTFSAFGPVDNGTQCLYGLDYRMAAWRGDEVDPFHTEVGYWLWDAEAGRVMRCFMVPRGTVVLAGGPATADARSFTMTADLGSQQFGVLENPYLAANASTVRYECTITLNDDGSMTYEEDTVLRMKELEDLFHHTDRNVMRKVEG
ncbi:MAG: heme-binding beta-barrel domain-containing protein [Acidimicrobiales bacterium]|jgi:hypothetical protein|nr:heme-binding beta-barrel domain-containing protein [Acidimicrobiales bacterium]